MQHIHFPSLDLNLLRVFDAMADELSVTRAGRRLGLSQSAVSHALRRLREALRDPLFVRGPDGMRPTARAEEMAPRLRQGLAQLQEALGPSAFDPATTTRRFHIAVSAYACIILMPEVVRLLQREAPGVEIRIRPLTGSLSEDLSTGRVDLAISGFGRAASRFDREFLFAETAVWAMRSDHPAAAETLTAEALADLPQALMGTAEDHSADGRIVRGGLERWVIWDDRGGMEEPQTQQGRSRAIGFTVPDAVSALAIVSRTDIVALVPRRLATAFAGQYGLKLFDPPNPVRTIAMEMLWRSDLGPSPAIDWLKGRFKEAAARL